MNKQIRQRELFALKTKVPGFSEKLAPIYKELNWIWGPIGPKVPSSADIADTLYRLIEGMLEHDYENSSTGGLEVEYDPHKLSASMSFVLTEFSEKAKP